jgi:hypothetical protein
LIDILRVGKYRASIDGTQEIGKGKSSVGKAINAEMIFAEALPEYLVLDVSIFENAFMAVKSYTVQCVLEPMEDVQKLQVAPLPGEIEAAFAKAEADMLGGLMDLLGQDAKTPVYYGTP